MTKKLVLVDGSSYLYRAYHAMPDLTTSSGETTGAIYGVINMLRRQMKEHPSDYLVVVFDAPGKTFRDDIYPAYKEKNIYSTPMVIRPKVFSRFYALLILQIET